GGQPPGQQAQRLHPAGGSTKDQDVVTGHFRPLSPGWKQKTVTTEHTEDTERKQKEEEAEGKGTSYICPVLSLFRVFLCLPWLNVFILPPSGAELLQRPL